MNVGNSGTIGGTIVAFVSAAIGLAVAFGVHVTPAEREAVIAFTTAAIAVGPLVGVAWDHSRRQTAARLDAAAIAAGNTGERVAIVAKGSPLR